MTTALPHDTRVDLRAPADDRCSACDHQRSAHDALGERFCAATTASALTRSCICR